MRASERFPHLVPGPVGRFSLPTLKIFEPLFQNFKLQNGPHVSPSSIYVQNGRRIGKQQGNYGNAIKEHRLLLHSYFDTARTQPLKGDLIPALIAVL